MQLELYYLAKQCSPTVSPQTMVALVKTESGGNKLALGINGARLKYQPKSESQAIAWVRYLDNHNYNYDVGLAQINSVIIKKYHLKPEQLFNPCLNLKIAGEILTNNYLKAQKYTNNPQLALKYALSMYNTGNIKNGFNNGYINNILKQIKN